MSPSDRVKSPRVVLPLIPEVVSTYFSKENYNVAQALVIMAAIFVGFTAPITAPQILWVNMVTSLALGLVVSFELHELDVERDLAQAEGLRQGHRCSSVRVTAPPPGRR